MLLSDNKKFPVVSSSSFPPPPPSSSPSFYTVLEGDNLIRISIKLNISVARLKKYNHLFGKNDVIVGQVNFSFLSLILLSNYLPYSLIL